MNHPLVPFLLLAALPALYLGHRLGWLEKRPAAWLGAAALLAGAAWSFPYRGIDLVSLKRFNLLIAAATALFLLLRHYRVPWTRRCSRRLAILLVLAALAVANYTNYFSFYGRGQRAFVQLHDVAHYYLGSKYYDELGYTGLYTAMLRAEAELYDNRFRAIEARDLESYERVHIRVLLERSDAVKAAFSEERWSDFRLDVAFFRERLEREQYARVLLDHGFNPTPVWALLGSTLANRVPAGSVAGIELLAFLDPLLILVAFVVVARVFGLETMLLALVCFCVVFGASFAWTGGAFLRFSWFAALVCALTAMHRQRFLPAGVLLGAASMLRVFPVLFLLPVGFKAAAIAWDRRRLPRGYRTLFVSFAATAAVLFTLTALLPGGTRHWKEFSSNMQQQLGSISPNVVGLTEALAVRPGGGDVTVVEFEALKERRMRIYRAQLILILLPALAMAALLARRRTDLGAAALGLPLLYLGLSLPAYYYVFLVLLILVHRDYPARLTLIFAAEAAPYVLQLFEEREGLVFIYRGLLLAVLYLALEIERRLAKR